MLLASRRQKPAAEKASWLIESSRAYRYSVAQHEARTQTKVYLRSHNLG